MITCRDCNERMEGDGYTSVLHCPYATEESYEYHEPDANPVYCGFEDEDESILPQV